MWRGGAADRGGNNDLVTDLEILGRTKRKRRRQEGVGEGQMG